MSLDAHDLRRGVVDECAADLDGCAAPQLPGGARRVEAVHDDEADGLLLRKVALDVEDARGEEARFAEEGAVGSRVDVERAVGLEAVDEPEVAVADGVRGGEEAGVQRGLLDGLVYVEGGRRLRERVFGVVVVGVFAVWGGVEVRGGRGGGVLLLGLDVADDLDDVARVGGAGDDGCYACLGG